MLALGSPEGLSASARKQPASSPTPGALAGRMGVQGGDHLVSFPVAEATGPHPGLPSAWSLRVTQKPRGHQAGGGQCGGSRMRKERMKGLSR